MKIINWVALAFVFIFITLAIYYLPRTVKVNDIKCISQYGLCSKGMSDSFEDFKGKDLVTVKNILGKDLKQNIIIDSYSLRFTLPGTLNVNIIEKTPRFALTDSVKSKYILADKNGIALLATDNTSLPTLVSMDNLPEIGNKIDEKKYFALQLLQSIDKEYKVINAREENDTMLVELNDYPKLIFPLEGDRDLLVGSMIFILTRVNKKDFSANLNEVDSKISIIDLRYKNPVFEVN